MSANTLTQNKERLKKFSLGTAQFGFHYGIANQTGQVSEKAAHDILSYAQENQIDFIDTAFAYGESETLLGRVLARYPHEFRISTKLAPLDEAGNLKSIEKSFYESFDRFGIPSFENCFIHHYEDFIRCEALLALLLWFQERGWVENAGISLYRTEELDYLLESETPFNVIQIPYSLFDRRFEPYFPELKKRGIRIFVRSVFLQGLVFLDPEKLPDYFMPAKRSLEIFKEFSRKNHLELTDLFLNFPFVNSQIDRVIVGVDSFGQFQENVASVNSFDKGEAFFEPLRPAEIKDLNILLPMNWPSP